MTALPCSISMSGCSIRSFILDNLAPPQPELLATKLTAALARFAFRNQICCKCRHAFRRRAPARGMACVFARSEPPFLALDERPTISISPRSRN
jgi:hypothetical protein